MKRISIFSLIVLVALTSMTLAAFGQKLKPDEIVAKHLESIGTAEARAAAKTRMAVGEAVVTFVSQTNQTTQGRIVLASAGEKNFFGLVLNASDYPGEKFSYNGAKAKVEVPSTTPRSYLNIFVDGNSSVLRDSLLTGSLASSWALADVGGKKGKVSGGGLKKVDGKEYYVLGYSPKGGGDWDISMHFDKETFRHARTEYKRTSSAGIGTNPNQSSGFDETKIKITETFGDYKVQGGLMIPNSYKLLYSETGQRGTRGVEWAFSLSEFAFNQPLDDKTFDIDAK